jgi:hypothetical protein
MASMRRHFLSRPNVVTALCNPASIRTLLPALLTPRACWGTFFCGRCNPDHGFAEAPSP